MRSASALLSLAAVILASAGCGSGEPDASAAGSTTRTTTSASAFPVTVEHRFGSTTVPSAPKRVAVVGLSEQDILLALGVVPIATTEWYGDQPSAVWPWAHDRLGGAKPTVLSAADGFQFERIARLAPDLIVGTNSGMKKEDYAKLSAIAPTIPAVKGATDYFSPWEGQTELIATAVGKADEGRLGFTINPRLKEVKTPVGQQVALSAERLDLADADVMVFATEAPGDVAALRRIPTFRRLRAVREHRAVFTDATLTGAMYFISPLSLPYVLEKLTPLLEAAVRGRAPSEMVDTSG